jgi:hypothetical protein
MEFVAVLHLLRQKQGQDVQRLQQVVARRIVCRFAAAQQNKSKHTFAVQALPHLRGLPQENKSKRLPHNSGHVHPV